MGQSGVRARVFISCGQSKHTDEVKVAHEIAERLTRMGFEPYIAVEEQTLRGVKENLFGQLEKSEYLVFVDFRREKIVTHEGEVFRGSLFSHQELAVSAYLDKQLIAFQEEGVKQDDGLIRFLQSNATRFSDRHLLASVVADMVQTKGWNPAWRNELVLRREPEQHVDATVHPQGRPARYFHINVRNPHVSKPAINCYVYLERVEDLESRMILPVETIEFKWQGYVMPNAVIGPGSARNFDAFWVYRDTSPDPNFNIFSDFTGFLLALRGRRRLELTFAVLSENFPLARGTFELHLGSTLDEVRFQEAKKEIE